MTDISTGSYYVEQQSATEESTPENTNPGNPTVDAEFDSMMGKEFGISAETNDLFIQAQDNPSLITDYLKEGNTIEFTFNNEAYYVEYNNDNGNIQAFTADGEMVDSQVQWDSDYTVSGFMEIGGIVEDSQDRLYMGLNEDGEFTMVQNSAELDKNDEVGPAGSHLATLLSNESTVHHTSNATPGVNSPELTQFGESDTLIEQLNNLFDGIDPANIKKEDIADLRADFDAILSENKYLIDKLPSDVDAYLNEIEIGLHDIDTDSTTQKDVNNFFENIGGVIDDIESAVDDYQNALLHDIDTFIVDLDRTVNEFLDTASLSEPLTIEQAQQVEEAFLELQSDIKDLLNYNQELFDSLPVKVQEDAKNALADLESLVRGTDINALGPDEFENFLSNLGEAVSNVNDILVETAPNKSPVDDRPLLDPDNIPSTYTEILDTHEQFMNWEDPAIVQHIADNRETIFAQKLEIFKDIPNFNGISESEVNLLHERRGGGSELADDLKALGVAQNAYATERVIVLEQKVLSVSEEQGISREESYLSLNKQDFIDIENQAFEAFQEVLDTNPRIQELFDIMEAEGINPGSFGQHLVDSAREYLSDPNWENHWPDFG